MEVDRVGRLDLGDRRLLRALVVDDGRRVVLADKTILSQGVESACESLIQLDESGRGESGTHGLLLDGFRRQPRLVDVLVRKVLELRTELANELSRLVPLEKKKNQGSAPSQLIGRPGDGRTLRGKVTGE